MQRVLLEIVFYGKNTRIIGLDSKNFDKIEDQMYITNSSCVDMIN